MTEKGISLIGKTALITGGGRGIGKSIAMVCARHGANVVITSRTGTQLQDVAKEIELIDGNCLSVKGDVSNLQDVTHIKEASLEAFGSIDILVNNAGISKESAFMDLSLSDWEMMIRVNLMGTVYCIREVLPEMRKKGAGKIINIASAAGLRGLPNSAAYSASKAAVIALTKSLGEEVGSEGIQVNVICPGPVDTDMLNESSVRDFVLKNPADLMSPDEIAGTALFLASELSGRMNSQVITSRTKNRW